MTVTADTSRHPETRDAIPSMGSYWHPIAQAAEVAEQPRRFKLLGEPVVAFRDSEVYAFIARNHEGATALENKGQKLLEADVVAAFERIMAQDRAIVESQRPEEIPLDLKDELHLKVPDATGIAYRRLLARISDSAAFMP